MKAFICDWCREPYEVTHPMIVLRYPTSDGEIDTIELCCWQCVAELSVDIQTEGQESEEPGEDEEPEEKTVIIKQRPTSVPEAAQMHFSLGDVEIRR